MTELEIINERLKENIIKGYRMLKKENRELKAYRDVMEQADFKGSFDKMCLENRELIAKLEKIKEKLTYAIKDYHYGYTQNVYEFIKQALQIIEGE